ncbi:DNA-formamidopyrimidine glycosylase family protein [Streptomyces sp. DSM 44917]|uniref:DNA-formamidopyrimidine glycosylase family protein n=1 Tax=Streptomyces boetiae TaxID=3075541 RepID=A0ABU2LD60_9ACTN|nr:DNA-formamidopyrimidine glycosylase family protein [Streptomyces sp. DSM 44917]MDT0309113.1 DNA-formamidopyrimidine glycosylase family protein [Streptomyces sp. DSM 44917]
MPELPEVEALRGFLADRLTGRTVATALPVAFHVLKTYDPPVSALAGRTVTAVDRHGKFLDLTLGAGDPAAGDVARDLHLVVHLARAGWLRWQERLPSAPPRPGKGPLAFRLALADPPGTGFDLTEAGTQKRLAVYCVADPAEVPGVARLGPDPLDPAFTQETFAALLAGENRQVKGVLRDQSVLAGVGNAYSDEVLHAARMSPFRIAARLDAEEAAALYAALTGTLREAVERSRGLAARHLKTEKKTGLRVHGRTGQPCPVCGDTVREVSYRDSSLQYCATCQTGGKPLADRRLSRLLK